MIRYLMTLVVSLSVLHAGARSRFINSDSGFARHHFLVTGSYINFLNAQDLFTEGNKRFMRVNNTNGYQIGFAYEYVSRRNISVTALTAYGKQKTDITWHFRFDGFHPGVDFQGYNYEHRYNTTIPYLNTSVLLGYEFQPFAKNSLKLQVKAGLGIIHYFKFAEEHLIHGVTYDNVDSTGLTHYSIQHTQTDATSGNRNNWLTQQNVFYTLYIGACYPVHIMLVRECRIGLTYTRATALFSGHSPSFNHVNANYYHYDPPTLKADGNETFENMFRSIAVTASIGF